MSDEAWDITPPPFNADATLQTLKRFARDQGLAERSEGWLLAGQAVLTLALDGATIQARLAKRPARSPEWEAWYAYVRPIREMRSHTSPASTTKAFESSATSRLTTDTTTRWRSGEYSKQSLAQCFSSSQSKSTPASNVE